MKNYKFFGVTAIETGFFQVSANFFYLNIISLSSSCAIFFTLKVWSWWCIGVKKVHVSKRNIIFSCKISSKKLSCVKINCYSIRSFPKNLMHSDLGWWIFVWIIFFRYLLPNIKLIFKCKKSHSNYFIRVENVIFNCTIKVLEWRTSLEGSF